MRGRNLLMAGRRSALERARPYIFTAMAPIVVLAVGSLVLEYGFPISPETQTILHWFEAVALAGMMLDWPLRLLLARNRWALLKFRWAEFSVVIAYGLAIAVFYLADVAHRDLLVLRTTHVAIVANLVMRLVELHRFLSALKVRPALLLTGSFLTLIAAGTGLLLLPAATAPNEPATGFSDALFTATSAVCVTGLTVVDTGSHWSRFGQYVILSLIQLGGLGLMTFGTVFAIFMWRGLRLRESIVMREVVSHDLVTEVRRVVLFILVSTVLIELVGALLMMNVWEPTDPGGALSTGRRFYFSVFHSVAAFCNAGFGLYPDNLMKFRETWQINLVIPLLIITGGIGFGVLYNLVRLLWYGSVRRGASAPIVKRRMTLQTKLAIVVTVLLLVGGTLLAYVFETFPNRTGAWQVTAYTPIEGRESGGVQPSASGAPDGDGTPLGDTWSERLVGAWFLSTTSRTAGFNSTDTTRLSPPTKFMTTVLMFVGASPGSTGGGIKTVTLAVIVLGVWSALKGRPYAQAFHRTIAWETVTRAMAILAVGVLWVALAAMVLCAWGLLEGSRFTFLDVLFETTSAFGTVGLSTGATPLLNTFGRLLICLTMFIGRVGPLTLFLAMQSRRQVIRYTYPTENVATS